MNLACPPLSHGRQWVLRMREFARIKPRSLKLRSEGVHMEVEHRPTKKKKKKNPSNIPYWSHFSVLSQERIRSSGESLPLTQREEK
ncbi:hypothetical protein ACKS0A_08795 [Histoplasma ohiense]